VQPTLKSLLSCLAGPAQILAQGESLPTFDYHCPLMSLPLVLEFSLHGIPAGAAYITPDGAR